MPPDPSDPRLDEFHRLWPKVDELHERLGVDHPDYQAAFARQLELQAELGMVEGEGIDADGD